MYISYPNYFHHEHSDQPCLHDLRLCSTCGDVYCVKCGKEWVKKAPIEYTITTSGTSVYTSTSNPPEVRLHDHS
jgi:hypothetical protein